ncbi:hypothetical protein NQ317_001863 [Molorchus minor]|uniref:Tudor domain-containing protein n=1 Tax=Molorchus minor TaxID=1323400 RepID=A0ABQ9JYE8_9CUCU|nr:hypothetical protein NQ317_001863 [Molorchus minor]
MIGSTEDIISHFEAITGLEVEDNVPYKSEELEMCLVLFKGPDDDEANWFRATVLSVEDDGYEVVFIDFGNQEKVKRSDLIGIPHKPEIVKHLKELLPEGEQVDVIVKGLGANGHHKYQIEIPSLYKALKVEGLY